MRFLLLNQCFYPDVMATAQQLTSLATALRMRGHAVSVIASNRGYDDPSVHFARREVWKGIEINRIPTFSLGKSSRWRRALNFSSFLGACTLRLFFSPRVDAVIALTSPPLISFLGALFARLRGGRFYFWVMDLNPDEAVAAGWLKPRSVTARILARLLHYSMRHAERIIALDRFMLERLCAKGIDPNRIEVISPWMFDDVVRFDVAGRDEFRAQHGWSEKFVVMHAGNHSPCHPLETLLGAAKSLSSESHIAFCFMGGGSELSKVVAFAAQHSLSNILCLPYQPLEKLAASLSAADLHVVVMGDAFVGIVHPSKIYNVLAVGAPVLYIGPERSSVSDIVAELLTEDVVYSARHGDVEAVQAHIKEAALEPWLRREASISSQFSRDLILPRFVTLVEENISAPVLASENDIARHAAVD